MAILPLAIGSGIAQERPPAAPGTPDPPTPAAVYRVALVIHEMGDETAVKTRRFMMLLQDGGSGSIRAGTRFPISRAGVDVVHHPAGTSSQYMDTGVIIECKLREREGQVVLTADIEISSTPSPPKAADSVPPSIPAVRSRIDTAVQPGKPTTIVSLEDPVTGHHFDVEANAVKVR